MLAQLCIRRLLSQGEAEAKALGRFVVRTNYIESTLYATLKPGYEFRSSAPFVLPRPQPQRTLTALVLLQGSDTSRALLCAWMTLDEIDDAFSDPDFAKSVTAQYAPEWYQSTCQLTFSNEASEAAAHLPVERLHMCAWMIQTMWRWKRRQQHQLLHREHSWAGSCAVFEESSQGAEVPESAQTLLMISAGAVRCWDTAFDDTSEPSFGDLTPPF